MVNSSLTSQNVIQPTSSATKGQDHGLKYFVSSPESSFPGISRIRDSLGSPGDGMEETSIEGEPPSRSLEGRRASSSVLIVRLKLLSLLFDAWAGVQATPALVQFEQVG